MGRTSGWRISSGATARCYVISRISSISRTMMHLLTMNSEVGWGLFEQRTLEPIADGNLSRIPVKYCCNWGTFACASRIASIYLGDMADVNRAYHQIITPHGSAEIFFLQMRRQKLKPQHDAWARHSIHRGLAMISNT